MSESCNLYLNPKWKASEIKELIERLTGKPAKWYHMEHEGDYGRLVTEEVDISCFFNYQTPIGAVTLLTRGSQGARLFEQIAKVIGGLLEPSDYIGNLKMIQGKTDEDGGLPYFVRYAIIHDGIDPDDIEALQDSMSKWYDQCGKAHKPAYLKNRNKEA